MRPLESDAVRWIFVHTAAWGGRGADVETIRRWHLERGWEGIGYHFVVVDDTHPELADGTIQIGRPLEYAGAHVYGANRRSVGICCAGHGDQRPFTHRQLVGLVGLCRDLIDRYGLTADAVLGHREVNRLVDGGELPAEIGGRSVRTHKTCPGLAVDMDAIRDLVRLYALEPRVDLAGAPGRVVSEDVPDPEPISDPEDAP